MVKITISIKTPFGEISVSGNSPQEVLGTLQSLDQPFMGQLNEKVSDMITSQVKDELKGIVEVGRDGPIIVTKKKLSHYAAIGLILYSLKDYQSSSRLIVKRLAASGKKVTVPARLHEMRQRGHVFKPVDRAPYYKLTTKGIKWIEEEILQLLKK